jgi:hypothetical protein
VSKVSVVVLLYTCQESMTGWFDKVSVVVLLYKCQYSRTGWCEQSVVGGFTVQMSVHYDWLV